MTDLVSKLSEKERILKRHALICFSPDDSKYADAVIKLRDYLTAEAEWKACAYVQSVFLQTRFDFGQAEQKNLDEMKIALEKFDPLNAALIEKADPKDGGTKHDQLAVIEELGRHMSEETKALLHPGTTSYDPLDTARSYLFTKAWREIMRPEMKKTLEKLSEISEKTLDILQVGRTHLQDTSPVLFGGMIAGYAARLANRVELCDTYFNNLRGKVSGMVGTGAGVEMVIGEGKSIEFEKVALAKLGLEPDYTATQIVQKERLADVGHGIVSLMHVLGEDLANDIRMMYSSAIGEVTSRDNAERIGGSSADATKNNPINYENVGGKVAVVEGGMRVLYDLISSDFQRDLRGSVQARYQPQLMMVEIYESFIRMNKTLNQLSINEDKIAENLKPVRNNPSEALGAILKGEKFVHPKYGIGHDFVKEIGKKAKLQKRNLLEVALEDDSFKIVHNNLSQNKKDILQGQIEKYTGSAKERARINLNYVKSVISKTSIIEHIKV